MMMSKQEEQEGLQALVMLTFMGLVIVCICIGVMTSEIIGWLAFGGTLFVLGLIVLVCAGISGSK
jgi:hypothetical protein